MAGGDGDDDVTGALVLRGGDGGAQGGAGGEAVVDEDHGAVGQIGKRAVAAKAPDAVFDLLAGRGYPRLDGLLTETVMGHVIGIDPDAAIEGHRPVAGLRGPGQQHLAGHQHVQRQVQLAGDRLGHGDAAGGDGQEQGIGVAVFGQHVRQHLAGIGAIPEDPDAIPQFRAIDDIVGQAIHFIEMVVASG